jgi:hypothetical protein
MGYLLALYKKELSPREGCSPVVGQANSIAHTKIPLIAKGINSSVENHAIYDD